MDSTRAKPLIRYRVAVGIALLIALASLGILTLAAFGGKLNSVKDEARRFEMLRGVSSVIALPDDLDLVEGVARVREPLVFGTHKTVYVWILEHEGISVGVALKLPVPEAYNGEILLAVGVDGDGRVTGVRALEHEETPGFGDAIGRADSPWMRSFEGRSLVDPEAKAWALKQDGGYFDAISGATVTSKAVLTGTLRALTYVQSLQLPRLAPAGPLD